MLKHLLLFGLICLAAVAPAAAQSDRFVALVVSLDDGTARADDVQEQLQLLGAETLRALSPNNAQMRSILKRFAREAADARITFVYLDVPLVSLNNRAYVLPANARVTRDTDLFTQGIPMQAFARSAAQATQGGAVVTTRADVPPGIPSTVTEVVKAPDAVPGSSPIAILVPSDFDAALAALASSVREDEMELGALLRTITSQTAATISAMPATPAFLKQAETVAEAEITAIPIEPNTESTDAPETPEELSVLEKSLSRSAKRAVQRELRNLGHYRGLVDGIFGPQTRTAISAFQTDREDTPTGVLSRRQLLDLSS